MPLVDQQPHQFGHGDRGMGVVELDGELLVEALGRDLLHADDAQHVLQRAGDEEVLLLEPQLLALDLLVVRIEHLGDVLRGHLLVHRAVIVAALNTEKSNDSGASARHRRSVLAVLTR